jgi:hypothetical protein
MQLHGASLPIVFEQAIDGSIGLTGARAIGGIISAVIFGFQLHEMKVAGDLTRQSIEISQRAII